VDFNIRAMSLAEGVDADARIALGDLLGQEIEFRLGISVSVRLPDTPEQFHALPEPERLLAALNRWTRLYRYPEADHEAIHVIAPAENGDEEILFYRIDLRQPPRPHPGPRPAVEIAGGAVMTYDQCAAWLVDLSYQLDTSRDKAQRLVVLARPRQVKPRQVRVAWVGPEIVDGRAMPPRLRAIGRVYGAEIVHVSPRSYRDVKARLAGASPLSAAIICGHFAPYIRADAVPNAVRRELIHICSSRNRGDLEQQVCSWIEIAISEIEKESRSRTADENQMLLNIVLRGMLSHSKIGQFNHCPKATALKRVRARHLNVAIAERVLDENSEVFHDTKSSNALFLWKEHHDGRQYFLNPQEVEKVKAMVAAMTK
jgi:hypothetical protein